MHHHLEILLPPVPDLKEAVSEILEPFCKEKEAASQPFWDYWVIGGRWSGKKLQIHLDQAKLKAFVEELVKQNVMVKSFQFGKQELADEKTVKYVDTLWQEWFPESLFKRCPLFRHSNDQYDSDSLIPGDIGILGEIDLSKIICSRVMFCGPNFEKTGLEVHHMEQEDFYNGVNFVRSWWDCKLDSAYGKFLEELKHYNKDFVEAVTPKANWLVVTVDYHS